MAGKKYNAALAMVNKDTTYNYVDAIALAKKTTCTTFDSTVEVCFHLNIDPRQADQNIRGAMVLPNGTGKSAKVLVIAQGAKADEAKAAGADLVGAADMIEKIQGGWMDFDIIVATPDMMGQLGRLGRVLGPRGLMPNPKTGTVTMDVTNAVEEIKKGKVEYRTDKDGNVNCIIGKASFTEEALAENYKALYEQIARIRPNSVKGQYIQTVSIATTMGPGIPVTVE